MAFIRKSQLQGGIELEQVGCSGTHGEGKVAAAPLRVLLVDPSLFTSPYDAALSNGLREAGVTPGWAVRGLRPAEEADLQANEVALSWYRRTDGRRRRTGRLWKAMKGIEHAFDLWRLERLVSRGNWDVVHFQWATLPLLDGPAMKRIARLAPVLLTVHDTTPFNGAGVSRLQVSGFDALCGYPDRLIVHTQSARKTLVERGVPKAKIAIIPHGPLRLRLTPKVVTDKAPERWRIVLFGRLQTYKGVDVLIEALGMLESGERARLEVVVAGEPLMDMEPLMTRAAALGLTAPCLNLRLGRLSDQQTSDLLGSADAFVFPYHAIEASGVLFLVGGLGKWMVASRLGAFADIIGDDGTRGELVAPGNAAALARALVESIGAEPRAVAKAQSDWPAIGIRTASVYREALAARTKGAPE